MNKKIVAFVTFCACLITLFHYPVLASPLVQKPTHNEAAIIIDDVGNGLEGSNQLFKINAPLTVAIMPFLRTSREDAIRAHKAGYEVILHVPMEPNHGKKSWLGPGVITTQMSDQEIKKTLRKEIDSIPYVKGMNNHMGSKATANQRVTKAILEVAKEKNLYVVDSVTTPHSKIIPLATQMGIPCISRSVFIDNENSLTHMKQQLMLILQQARHRGWSVGIGHVGHQGLNTTSSIQSMLPVFKKSNVNLVHVSKIIQTVSQLNKQKSPDQDKNQVN